MQLGNRIHQVDSCPSCCGCGWSWGRSIVSDLRVNYATGIAFCLTGGSSSTDNTNAAVGIFGVIKYK
jgi:hypothetical protein